MAYIKLSVNTESALADEIAEALMNADAYSVTLEDGANQEIFEVTPNEKPLWQDVCVQALFPTNSSPREIIRQVKEELGLDEPLNYKIEKIADQDWVRLSQQNFKPQCYANKLWIVPSWHEKTDLTGAIVEIDPGLAFGTGTHATTSLCLTWLTTLNLKDKTVIDYGCGSGILALAALALGAKQVIAIDHDHQALEATQNNAKLNSFANDNNLIVRHSDALTDIAADVVVANILANPLIDLAHKITDHVAAHGLLLLSGVLETEEEKVLRAYAKYCELNEIQHEQGWLAIELHKA